MLEAEQGLPDPVFEDGEIGLLQPMHRLTLGVGDGDIDDGERHAFGVRRFDRDPAVPAL